MKHEEIRTGPGDPSFTNNEYWQPLYEHDLKRDKAFQQHLDSLPDFQSKLEYWRTEVCKTEYRGTGMSYLEEEPPFELYIRPTTEEEEEALLKCELDWWRTYLADNKAFVRKGIWLGLAQLDNNDFDYNNTHTPILFHIHPFEYLKSDLESRLLRTIRKEDLLDRELELISSSINETGLLFFTNKLRLMLETNRPVTLKKFINFIPEATGMRQLANFWDIIYYESYLKDRIASLKSGELVVNQIYVMPTDLMKNNQALPSDNENKLAGSPQLKLTHSQIAILYHYIKHPITRNNANEIAKVYGHKSGQKLEETYKDLVSPLTRTSRGKNKVKDIKAVLELLTGAAKILAESELKKAIENNQKYI